MISESPFTFGEARQAAHHASQRQLDAETARVEAARDSAGKELTYRRLLAEQIVKNHASGIAWTVAADVARGDDAVSSARFDRDVAAAVLQAQEQAGFRLNADRRVLERLVEWSMRRELAEGGE
jgi:hypothetical protein